MKAEQRIECDVLVVGGGGAGPAAAIAAAERGVSVVVAAKGKAGRSGNTMVAGSQYCAVVPYPGSPDSPEQHFQDTLAGGRGVNDERLLRVFAEQGGSRVLQLERWGVRLLRSNGELIRRRPPGHSRERGIPTDNEAFRASVGGLSITLPLRAAAEARGVRFLDGTPVVRLLSAGGEVCGALAIDPKKEELLEIGARAVVVASGGAGRLYSSTNNTRGICGDSYGLLLRAGATLKDMEFVQYYPTQMVHPFKALITNPVFMDGAVLRNRYGERFMQLYDPVKGDQATRDVMSRAIFYEVQKGNGIDGEVYADCTAVPEEVLRTKYGAWTKDLRAQGIDPRKDWVKVSPTTHFFMGGVEVDESCRTGVSGLFAAGEAVGGVHGANRLSGNALTETAVFGPIAGEAAAEYARARHLLPRPDPSSTALQNGGSSGVSLDAVRQRLRRAMWDGASIVRSEQSLRSALGAVRECAAEVERCAIETAAQAARREETLLMCLAAEAIVLSALARRESRGAHFREDFPASEDGWLGNNRVRLHANGLQVEFTPKPR